MIELVSCIWPDKVSLITAETCLMVPSLKWFRFGIIERHSHILRYLFIYRVTSQIKSVFKCSQIWRLLAVVCTQQRLRFFRHCLCYNQSVVLFIELEIVLHLQFAQTIMGFIEFRVATSNLEQWRFGCWCIKTNLEDLINQQPFFYMMLTN